MDVGRIMVEILDFLEVIEFLFEQLQFIVKISLTIRILYIEQME